MTQELKPTRYEFTSPTWCGGSVSADRDEDPDGEYVLLADVQDAIDAWNRRSASIEPEVASASIVRYSPNCVTGVAGMMEHPHGSYVLLKDHVAHCAQQVADWKSEAERHKEANQILLSKFFDMANERDDLRAQLAEWQTAANAEARLADEWRERAIKVEAQLAARIEPVEPAGYLMQHSTGIDKGFSWTDNNPLFSSEWIKTPLYAAPQPIAQPAPSIPEGWRSIETAPKDMAARLYLIGRYCVQGFVDAAGALMVQSEVSPHWRKMRGHPTHWMPLPAAPKQNDGGE